MGQNVISPYYWGNKASEISFRIRIKLLGAEGYLSETEKPLVLARGLVVYIFTDHVFLCGVKVESILIVVFRNSLFEGAVRRIQEDQERLPHEHHLHVCDANL